MTDAPPPSAPSRANLPYWVAILLAGSLLVWFLMTQDPFATGAGADESTTTTATTIATDGSTTTSTTTDASGARGGSRSALWKT